MMGIDDFDNVRTVRSIQRLNVYRGTSPATQNRLETNTETSSSSRVVKTEKAFFEKEETRYQSRIRELEDSLDFERDHRVRVEKLLAETQFQYDQLSDRLEEQGGQTSAQIEISKKRESELSKLRKDLEIVNIAHEGAEQSLRKRHNQAIADLTDQLEHMSKTKNRVEKEKHQLIIEIDGLQGSLDSLTKAKTSAENRADALAGSCDRLKGQVDDLTRQVNDLSGLKARLTQENFDLQHQVQELDSNNAALAKAKAQLQASNDDLKRNLDDESRQRQNLQVQVQGLQVDFDSLN
ncbi:hypothetical protein LOTGIDRAFT_153233, partial [Lottia gigantea]